MCSGCQCRVAWRLPHCGGVEFPSIIEQAGSGPDGDIKKRQRQKVALERKVKAAKAAPVLKGAQPNVRETFFVV